MEKHAKRRGTKGIMSTTSTDAAKKGRRWSNDVIRAPRVSRAFSAMAAAGHLAEPEVKKSGRKWSDQIIRKPHGSLPFDAAGMDSGYKGMPLVSDPGREQEAISAAAQAASSAEDQAAADEMVKGKLLGDARTSAMNDEMQQSGQAQWDQLRTKLGGANAANVSTARRK